MACLLFTAISDAPETLPHFSLYCYRIIGFGLRQSQHGQNFAGQGRNFHSGDGCSATDANKSHSIHCLQFKKNWAAACFLTSFMDSMNLVRLFQKFALSRAKDRAAKMETSQRYLHAGNPLVNLSPILLSGDNARSVHMLHCDLIEQGFRMQFAASYDELLILWQEERQAMVLLEVSGAHSVEAAVGAALRLKRIDPLVFVGYLADPVLHTSGLAGDAIFPRASAPLAKALREHFDNEA
jgi:hypothetical protein